MDDTQIIDAYRLHRSKEAAAASLGMAVSTYKGRLKRALERAGLRDDPENWGQLQAIRASARSLPKKGAKRYIVTSAQNNTSVNIGAWENLQALADHYDAELLVTTYSYDKAAYGNRSVKRGQEPTVNDGGRQWYDPVIVPHICDDRVELAPGLVLCGEMNILPTAVRPLSGLEGYTGRKSGIFPHAKMALHSIASHKQDATKINYTTGTVTLRNYIAKKAGLKAEFHHVYGGLLVEVDSEGDWFVRQLNADSNDAIFDLDLLADGGEVTEGHHAEALNWGDVHVAKLDPLVRRGVWASGGMLDVLQPSYQFMHDTLDFHSRNHHEMKNAHHMFERYVKGQDCVEAEVEEVHNFLSQEAWREWCQTVVVDSNHDNAMSRWLREADYRLDPVNARYFLELQLEVYRAIEKSEYKNGFHLLRHAINRNGNCKAIFLDEDESFIICPDAAGGIECGMHGDLGPNGARGGLGNLSKMGRKANTGHSHSAAIVDGLYVAGVSGSLDMSYNRGPSSWTHSHIITYPNGKRSLVTMWNGKWRAVD